MIGAVTLGCRRVIQPSPFNIRAAAIGRTARSNPKVVA
jgi:hypothetical protein